MCCRDCGFVTYNPLFQNPSTYIIFLIGGLGRMITKQLGARIQELRKQKELSQEKFALKIEMDRTYYASVEAGKRNISVRNIKKIADGLGVSMSQLFEGI